MKITFPPEARSAVEQTALSLYQRHYHLSPVQAEETFARDLAGIAQSGIAIVTFDSILLLKPIPTNAFPEELGDPSFMFPADRCDCWLVWLAIGRLHELRKLVIGIPPKNFIGFARRNRLKFHKFELFESVLARTVAYENTVYSSPPGLYRLAESA